MKDTIFDILTFLKQQKGYDFMGNRLPMLERRISKRVFFTQSQTIDEYFTYLKTHPEEEEALSATLTINISHFFRDPLMWAYLTQKIMPTVLDIKEQSNSNELRIWSAGCASGEEPYTISIIIKELLQKKSRAINSSVFATDIDKTILEQGILAHYLSKSLKNIPYHLLGKYFQKEESHFSVKKKVKEMVRFSFFDLLHPTKYTPEESIFGNFDIVLCRNVLIYFNEEFKEIIFDKLYRSLRSGGYLILGESEIPSDNYKELFKRINSCCNIYQKV